MSLGTIRGSGTTYRLIKQIGANSRSTTYRAEHAVLGTPLVLIVMNASEDDPGAGSLFGQLAHPNIVEARDAGLTDERPPRPYVVFERLNGRTLREVLDLKTNGIGALASVTLMTDVYRALEFAHDAGIVHGAFTARSVFLHRGAPERTTIKVLDFLIGRRPVNQRIARQMSIDHLRYLAPEQLRGEGCTPATDLHSSGLVFCECITGERPFAEANDAAELMAAKLDSSPRPVSVGVAETNPLLRDLLLGLLEHEKGGRPRSARSVLEVLDDVRRRTEEPTDAPKTPPPQPG